MRGKQYLQALNFLGFLVMLSVNYAANAVPLNNLTTGEVSNLYYNLFTPAAFTFYIWGVIYLLLFSFCIYQARDLFSSQKKEMSFLQQIGWLFIFSSILNAVWIFSWHYQYIMLSMLVMVFLLVVLIIIYFNLEVGRKRGSSTEAFLVHLPFRIYLGWIIIAAIANASALLTALGRVQGLTEIIWTVGIMLVTVIINLLLLKYRHDYVISLVSLWALAGIAAERLSADPVIIPVLAGTFAAMAIIFVFTAKTVVRLGSL